jgi:osmotically-inducible protein OsmY
MEVESVQTYAQQQSLRKLAEEIEGVVQRRTGFQIRDLQVEVYPDCIVISGRAPTYYAKQLAQHAAMDVAGHDLLHNRIEVC